MTSQKKAAPGPGLAGWLDGNPAPVVIQAGTRQRPDLRGRQPARRPPETVTVSEAEHSHSHRNFSDDAPTPVKPWSWRDAQKRSSAVRGVRSQLRRDIRNGALPLEVLVLAAPAEIRKLRVYDVLCWAPRVGNTRARRMAQDDDGVIVSETITIGALGENTRARLARRVADVLGRG